MKKFSFKNDYSEGCHPAILNAFTNTNYEQYSGYGDDDISQEAVALIRGKMKNEEAAVHFVSGGTQANLIIIGAFLRPHECVVAAVTGHIFVHEAGAIEATGHKIEAVPAANGKLTPEHIKAVLAKYGGDIHMVKPRMVYISNSTEIGTIYLLNELTALFECCKENGLLLFMDGARLGSALCAEINDITLADLSRLTDVFYIGGTKNGALLGEAIVINNKELQADFLYHLKQRGALMAKGRVLGAQFAELFRKELFFNLARHANTMAYKLAGAIRTMGFDFLTDSPSNQIFPIFPAEVIEKMLLKFEFYLWEKVDGQRSAVRLVTSWATPESAVDSFIEELRNCVITAVD